MDRKERKEFAQLACLLMQEGKLTANYNGAPEIADVLKGLAARLHRYAETACSYGLTEKQQQNAKRLADKVLAIVTPLGIGVTFNSDPRGYAVKLHFPSGAYNTWGGKSEGWGI